MFKGLVLVSLIGYGLAAPGMIFNCADNLQGRSTRASRSVNKLTQIELYTDICDNMCWGAYCTRPSFGVTLNYDRYGGTGNRNSAVGRARQTSAGCLPRPNRCSARTVTSIPSQVHRTPMLADRSQSVSLADTTPDCQFIVTFGNPAAANVHYCQAYSDPSNLCINNQTALIYKNGAPDVTPTSKKRSELEPQAQSAMFLMASGMEVLMRMSFSPRTFNQRGIVKNLASTEAKKRFSTINHMVQHRSQGLSNDEPSIVGNEVPSAVINTIKSGSSLIVMRNGIASSQECMLATVE
nr:hypothetical protein CFP56_63377 [Quercus suber]POE94779.1 hypothetical protein CFP56_17016 [Quercus suber]